MGTEAFLGQVAPCFHNKKSFTIKNNGRGGIRTPEGLRHLVYSQAPLATWVPAPVKPTAGFEPATSRLQGACSTG